ncbi:DUF202 domain-containing protein [Streptomyces sp. NPDC005876]|uniref:DUF202 domain-containing protein n=1 Tax=Streptomyces sp. NPDC005876 TaxID=3157076 RepID=UPI0033FA02E8
MTGTPRAPGAGTGTGTGSTATADRDPGLQPERTRLAWRRTTLAGAVAAVLATKAALHGPGASAVTVAAGALCCVLWLGVLRLAHRRIRALAATGRPPALTPAHAAAVALCAVATAACGMVLVLA